MASFFRLRLVLTFYFIATRFNSAIAAVVTPHSSTPQVTHKSCTDSEGNPSTKGLCNKNILISVSVIVPVVLIGSLATWAYIRFRRRQTDDKMMEELGIDTKPSFSIESRERPRTVKVKLPGLSIPTGKRELNDNDSIMTPISSPHVGQ